MKTVAVDLGQLENRGSDGSQTGWGRLQEAVEGLDVGLLINNVGLSYDHPEFFGQLSESDSHQIIQLNVQAATKVSRPCPTYDPLYTTPCGVLEFEPCI